MPLIHYYPIQSHGAQGVGVGFIGGDPSGVVIPNALWPGGRTPRCRLARYTVVQSTSDQLGGQYELLMIMAYATPE